MQIDAIVKIFTVVACFTLVSLSGCANFLVPEVGTLALEEARIILDDSRPENAVWQTKDLTLTYSIRAAGDELNFVGRLDFNRSLSDSYNVIKSFYLKMSFIDDHGQVLETVDITPFFSLYGKIPKNMTVNKKIIMPPDSSSIAFNYYGVFRGDQPLSGEDKTIFYFPFE